MAYEAGARFYKLSGSGNDFVVFDHRGGGEVDLPDPATVRRLCRRGEGVGADGLLLLRDEPGFDYRLIYYNADGSRADLCGNATLCGVRLAVELGEGGGPGEGKGTDAGTELRFLTDAGAMRGRMRTPTRPEIDLAPVTELIPDRSELWELAGGAAPDEERMGFAVAGVPHLVVLCDDASAVPLTERAPGLRCHPALPHGANVNYVSRGARAAEGDGGHEWEMRTFERGVEAETLACGTGAVATALLLTRWQVDGASGTGEGTPVRLRTRSGRLLEVSLREEGGELHPSLSGEARIVYRGELVEG